MQNELQSHIHTFVQSMQERDASLSNQHEAATPAIRKEDENNMGKRTDARSTPPSHRTLRPLPPSSKKDFRLSPSPQNNAKISTCSSPSNTSVGVGELQQILVADLESGQCDCKFAHVRPKLDNQTTRAAIRETRGLPDEQHTSPHTSPHTCPQPLNLFLQNSGDAQWLSAGAADARMHASVGSGGGGGGCHAQGGLSSSRGGGGVRGAGGGEGGGVSRSGGGDFSSKATQEVVYTSQYILCSLMS
jgi:hypothetical protein